MPLDIKSITLNNIFKIRVGEIRYGTGITVLGRANDTLIVSFEHQGEDFQMVTRVFDSAFAIPKKELTILFIDGLRH